MLRRRPKHVLIVDDDGDFTFLLHKALLKANIECVESVTSAGKAVQHISGLTPNQSPVPDLIFTDLKMTGVDGFELLAWLQRNPLFQKIPVIVLSGSSDPEELAKANALGAQSVYEKPHNFSDLQKIVGTTLDNFESWQPA